MSDLLNKLRKNTTIKDSDILSDSKFFNAKDMIRTTVPAINIALSGKINGGFVPGLTIWAGPSKHFKTSFSLLMAKAYMDTYPDAVMLFYDSEFGTPQSYFDSFGIDTSRVLHTPITDVEQLKFDIMHQFEEIKRGDRVIVVIDSVGNLASKKEVEDAAAIAQAMCRARDLVHTPANIKTPAWMGKQAESFAKGTSLKVKVYAGAELKEFGGLKAVGGSSPKPGPRMIEVSYQPKSSKKSINALPHIVLVGKGITFDTGGISLKRPYDTMMAMKSDMAGSAAILATLTALIDGLSGMRAAVDTGDRTELLRRLTLAREARANLPSRMKALEELSEVRIPIPDRAGAAAEVFTLAAELGVNIPNFEVVHSVEGDRGIAVVLVETSQVELFRGGLMARGFRPAVQRLAE